MTIGTPFPTSVQFNFAITFISDGQFSLPPQRRHSGKNYGEALCVKQHLMPPDKIQQGSHFKHAINMVIQVKAGIFRIYALYYYYISY